jgi:hypothetical protein
MIPYAPRPALIRLLGGPLLAALTVSAADAPVEPLRVCEVLSDLSAHEGKIVAIQGRYSYRTKGRYLSEESCDRPVESGGVAWPNALEVVLDAKVDLSLPKNLEYSSSTVFQNLKAMRQHTSLAKFRFGSVEYDRWAVVYGRVEVSKDFKAGDRKAAESRGPFDPAPARVICPGEIMILLLAEPER